ncbi:hypothetical protein SCUCBS95973_004428 [Sporothrix curviconia]|uniref:Cyclase n=1 Tax=Sporothrix curviconia TaxID=1260050 RepID=A0ABP0BNM6_9PEZI
MPITLPPFDALPLDKAGPPGNAWGLWGPDDQLGRLNLLTPETVAAAAAEIKEGLRISLDWPLDRPSHPTFNRQQFEHRIINAAPMTQNDDAVHFNTQSSTQWDGVRHYEDFQPGSGKLGIDAYANNGGIIGRGVLLDWASWAARNGINRSPFQTGAIELAHLKAIVAETDIQFRQGDILFIRSGFTAAYNALSAEGRQNFPSRKPGGLLGVEATRDSLPWLWENGFAAVAGDAMGFERGPATGPYNDPDVRIHQWALGGWGMPIGEMFELEALAEACRSRERWHFFLTSVPLKVPGGVASPGNAVAIL